MFDAIFNPENGFFRFTGRFLDILVLSILWLACSLPIVTIGPATAALYYSCVKCLRHKQISPYRNFLSSFRENLKTGVGATVVFLLLGLLLYVGFLFLLAFDDGRQSWAALRVAYVLVALLPMAVMSCAFPLLSRFTFDVGGLLISSVQMTFRHLPTMLLVALLNAALVLVTWMGWYFGLMLLTPALGALVSSYLLERVFRKYTPDNEPDGYKPWYLH